MLLRHHRPTVMADNDDDDYGTNKVIHLLINGKLISYLLNL